MGIDFIRYWNAGRIARVAIDGAESLDEDDIGLRHLRVLSLLLEVGSITHAAQILDTTQSSVSKILAKLRVHFGDPLFVRVGLSLRPTPKAIELAQPLRELLTASDAMRSSTSSFDPGFSTREFSVLVTEVGMIQMVPPLMVHLEKAGQGLRLKAVPLDSRQFGARLEAGEADVALGMFPGAAATTRRQRLYSETYVSVVRKGHPRIRNLCGSGAFLRERHIMVTFSNTGHAVHQVLEQVLTSKLNKDHVQVRVPSFVTAAFVASRTDAVASIPARLAEYLVDDLQLAVFRTPLNLPRVEISQFWHERVHADRGHRWFRAAIYELFGASRATEASELKRRTA
jgi:DNA-binding transcriptional LysR family regulator